MALLGKITKQQFTRWIQMYKKNLPSIDKGTEWILLAILSPGLRIISPFSDKADKGHPRHFTEASHLSNILVLDGKFDQKLKT